MGFVPPFPLTVVDGGIWGPSCEHRGSWPAQCCKWNFVCRAFFLLSSNLLEGRQSGTSVLVAVDFGIRALCSYVVFCYPRC